MSNLPMLEQLAATHIKHSFNINALGSHGVFISDFNGTLLNADNTINKPLDTFLTTMIENFDCDVMITSASDKTAIEDAALSCVQAMKDRNKDWFIDRSIPAYNDLSANKTVIGIFDDTHSAPSILTYNSALKTPDQHIHLPPEDGTPIKQTLDTFNAATKETQQHIIAQAQNVPSPN